MADKALVYLIQGVNSYKIGVTSNLPKRLKTFKTANPDIRLVAHTALMARTPALWLEQRLHVKYAHKLVAGEWFDLSPKDVMDVIELWSGKSGKRKQKRPILKSALIGSILYFACLLTAATICAMMVW